MKQGDEIVRHTVRKEHQQIAIGSILGDGHLTKPNSNGSRLWLKYSDKSFLYLVWLREQLQSFGVGEVKIKKGYNQHYFLTDGSEYLAELHGLFYPDGRTKKIPDIIDQLIIHPIALAVWYMDDGNLDLRAKYHRTPTIATYCFALGDCIRLTEMLKMNFGISAKVHKSTMRNKVYYRLYILAESVDRFFEIIAPYMHPCFSYKILEGRQQPR